MEDEYTFGFGLVKMLSHEVSYCAVSDFSTFSESSKGATSFSSRSAESFVGVGSVSLWNVSEIELTQ